jgi:hypothetical protein
MIAPVVISEIRTLRDKRKEKHPDKKEEKISPGFHIRKI